MALMKYQTRIRFPRPHRYPNRPGSECKWFNEEAFGSSKRDGIDGRGKKI